MLEKSQDTDSLIPILAQVIFNYKITHKHNDKTINNRLSILFL